MVAMSNLLLFFILNDASVLGVIKMIYGILYMLTLNQLHITWKISTRIEADTNLSQALTALKKAVRYRKNPYHETSFFKTI